MIIKVTLKTSTNHQLVILLILNIDEKILNFRSRRNHKIEF